MLYAVPMKDAQRFPQRRAGWPVRLALAASLLVPLGACSMLDGILYAGREGTVEHAGSGAAPGTAASYVVRERETVEQIARRFGVPAQTIIDRNKLTAPYTLRPGQNLEIPGAKPEAVAAATAPPTPTATVRAEPLPPPRGAPAATGAPPQAAPGQPTPLSTAAASPPSPTPATGPTPRFDWPLQGRVITPYGPRQGGQKNDGIDIAGERGAAVKAADSGTVVYAGTEVRGMGNLLLISHAGGYVTAYAHNEALLVKKGDAVRKGQTVARVGNSGGVPDPRLHFEVRRGNRTIDPMTVLPPAQ